MARDLGGELPAVVVAPDGPLPNDLDRGPVLSAFSSRDDYLTRYDAAVDAAIAAGFVLAADAADLRRTARERELPLE